MNEERIAAYGRLMQIGEQLYGLLERRGLTGERLDDAFDALQSAGRGAARDTDITLSTLSGYAAALGGRVEVRLVLPDETIVIGDSDPAG